MRLRVYLAVSDPALRARLTALFGGDADVVLVGQEDEADIVVSGGAASSADALGAPAVEEGTSLTPRELEVIRLMALGLGNKTIARELGISTHTAKFHVASVLAKLGAHSRTEAVSQGIRQGLVPL
ncbi:MAG TPA: LuxR C-terminal-related transcriptional regulator [Gemmatimonadales bacterium]|nr:LuxR C-terminal-related transcriptional regulator [Gemmatimonadales bacterium]